MSGEKETDRLFNQNAIHRDDCNLCKESKIETGKSTGYGIIVCKTGELNNGWFATLSPKTGGDPAMDFTIQLMPLLHLTHFSQIASYPGLMENYGIAFSRICRAITSIMIEDGDLKATSEEKTASASIATYGKCTTWKEKKEHLHIKIFPFRNTIGQPYTVDSSFGRKYVFKEKTGEEFVKMNPVKKAAIGKDRLDNLAKRLISLLKK